LPSTSRECRLGRLFGPTGAPDLGHPCCLFRSHVRPQDGFDSNPLWFDDEVNEPTGGVLDAVVGGEDRVQPPPPPGAQRPIAEVLQRGLTLGGGHLLVGQPLGECECRPAPFGEVLDNPPHAGHPEELELAVEHALPGRVGLHRRIARDVIDECPAVVRCQPLVLGHRLPPPGPA
jgi:hypothetical protein